MSHFPKKKKSMQNDPVLAYPRGMESEERKTIKKPRKKEKKVKKIKEGGKVCLCEVPLRHVRLLKNKSL